MGSRFDTGRKFWLGVSKRGCKLSVVVLINFFWEIFVFGINEIIICTINLWENQ